MNSPTNYLIKRTTLDAMAESIRRKYNFDDRLSPEAMPLYVSNDFNEFFLTHYNKFVEGGGVVLTDTSNIMLRPWHYYAKFTPSESVAGGYTISNIWNNLKVNSHPMRYFGDSWALMSQGKSYSGFGIPYTSTSGNIQFHDNGSRLTDGSKLDIYPAASESNQYSAWMATDEIRNVACGVVVDLGEVKNVGKFTVYGAYNFWGVGKPMNASIYVSTDNVNFLRISDSMTYKDEGDGYSYNIQGGGTQPSKLYSMSYTSLSLYSARYIKFEFNLDRDQFRWIWLSEVEVHGDTTGNYYKSWTVPISGQDADSVPGQVMLYSSYGSYVNSRLYEDFALLIRPISGTDRYQIVANNSYNIESISAKFVEGDKILAFCGYTEGADLSVLNSSNAFIRIDGSVIELVVDKSLTFNYNVTLSQDEFIYDLNYGNNYPSYGMVNMTNYESAAATSMMSKCLNWKVGSHLIIEGLDLENKSVPTTTPQYPYYNPNYKCTATYDMFESDTIVIDGDVQDSGWVTGGWLNIDRQNGTFTSGQVLNSSMAYSYKIKTDDKYLYVGFVTLADIVRDGNEPMVRIWLKTDPSASIFTHVYGVRFTDSGVVGDAKYNPSKTANQAQPIDGSSIEFAVKSKSGLTCVEFKVALSEFNGLDGFDYYFCHSNTVNGTYAVLYGESIIIPDGENRQNYFPYNSWLDEYAHHVDADPTLTGDEIISALSQLF